MGRVEGGFAAWAARLLSLSLRATSAVLLIGTLDAAALTAQDPQTLPGRESGAQRDNTRARDVLIPFQVGESPCMDRTRAIPVTMWIYNVLAQPVAVATLIVTPESDPVPPGFEGRPLYRLPLPCGRYVARWDGHHTTGRRLPPGVYVADLVVDGQRATRKITLPR